MRRIAEMSLLLPFLVRRAIQDRLTGQRPSMDAISEALHMSSRTLQRRLQESGSSFQRVLDEARHQMARYYLSNSVLELNEAAYLLGFEDPNSFGRAFRTWGRAAKRLTWCLIALLALIEASRAIWSRSKERRTSYKVGGSDGTRTPASFVTGVLTC